ncbi:iron chelate uptake ABC transporter family permease subunit, partial [uncultured Amnibacterium sp.]|uniref:iron chelate uptake ABC transporter family permease subunit n=1 Tax=uncultured Amnibacterium sp. TaxID=1631851 RepID=UPI0035CBFCB6
MTVAHPAVRAAAAVGRRRRAQRRRAVSGALALVVAALLAVSLMVGDTFYTPSEVLRTLLGQTVPGASFTVGELRLPRAELGTLAGAAFGLAGITFQTMLRNPLAAPDVIGISSGA